jgi:hypothetical protein
VLFMMFAAAGGACLIIGARGARRGSSSRARARAEGRGERGGGDGPVHPRRDRAEEHRPRRRALRAVHRDVFFFILFCNLLGLVPWGATPTGNISVTAALAIMTFVTVEVAGMRELGFKGYMGTIFYAPHGHALGHEDPHVHHHDARRVPG